MFDRKRMHMIALTMIFILALSGCAREEAVYTPSEQHEGENAEETPEYQQKLAMVEPEDYTSVYGLDLEAGSTISVIGKSASDEFWDELKRGAKQAQDDINAYLGYEGEDQIKVNYSGATVADSVDEQVNILDEELARYPVAIAIAISDTKSCEVQFDLAGENGIPIVAVDSSNEYAGIVASIETKNKESGTFVAEQLAEDISGEGEVVIFTNNVSSQSIASRLKGFRTTLKEYEGITHVRIVNLDNQDKLRAYYAKGNGLDTEKDAEELEALSLEELVDYLFESMPDTKAVFATDDDATEYALATVKRLGADVKVYGYDADREEIEALKNGEIAGLIVQNPFGMGYAAVVAAARASLGMANEGYVNTGYKWVTAENVDSEEIQAILY